MDHAAARLGAPLSPRERETLAVSAKGLTIEQVAHELGLSGQTVKNYHTSAYRKLGVSSMVAAFRKLGWLRPR